MKKTAIALLLCLILPLGAFALDLYGGVNIYYVSMVRPDDVVAMDTAGLNAADFALGGEMRLIAGPFWAGSVATFAPGDANLPHRVDFIFDGGLGFALGIVHAGIGIGPNFGLEIGDNSSTMFKTRANLRLTGDIVLGPFLAGVNWISKVDFSRASIADAFRNPYGQLGVSLLFGF